MKILILIWTWLWTALIGLWGKLFVKKPTHRRVTIIEGDTPPDIITGDNFVLAREDDEDWAVAFLCPCGCKDRLELALTPEVKPHWTLKLDEDNHPTLHPSVWRKTGCRAHFWVKAGEIVWCE